jgi:hypothetical protein
MHRQGVPPRADVNLAVGSGVASTYPLSARSHTTMTSQYRLETIDENEKLSTKHRTIFHRLQDHRQLAWLLCATTSLLTTRHLLIEENIHYPLQLYISQISATAIITLGLHPWRRKTRETGGQERHGNRSWRQTLIPAAVHCVEALSAYCTLQAVLHTANLPLLCMLIVGGPTIRGSLIMLTPPADRLLR